MVFFPTANGSYGVDVALVNFLSFSVYSYITEHSGARLEALTVQPAMIVTRDHPQVIDGAKWKLGVHLFGLR